MIKQKISRIVASGLLLASGLFALNGTTFAAGSLHVTAEPTSGTWTTSTTYPVSLYGTTSGSNTSGFSFTVTLNNLTIDHYDASGNPFSVDSVVSGGTQGSSTVTITTGYSDPAGGAGKLFVGKLYVVTKSTASTGTLTISGVDAYDNDLNAMSGTAGGPYSYAVSAPATPTTTTPSSSGNTTSNSSNTSTTTSKKTSTVTVPTSTNNNTTVTPQTITQSDATALLAAQAPEVVGSAVHTPTGSVAQATQKNLFNIGSRQLVITGSVLGGLLLLTGGFILATRLRARHQWKLAHGYIRRDADMSAAGSVTPTFSPNPPEQPGNVIPPTQDPNDPNRPQ